MAIDPTGADAGSELKFEELVADIAARFVNESREGIDAAIVDSQRQIVEALDLDRSALFQLSDAGDLVLTHVWTREGLNQGPGTLSAAKQFPWYLEQLRAGETVVVADARDVSSAIDRASLTEIDTKANVVVPLSVGGTMVGGLTFAALRAPRPWSDHLVQRLQLIGHVFSQALARRRHDEALHAALTDVQRLRDLLSHENEVLRHEVTALRPAGALVVESASARKVLERIEQVAPTPATVLLEGETGSGKDVFAQRIHELSPRSKRPMVRVNCGAIPTALLESELFGRERGAFTGAVARQIGRFEMAAGSTIFLDEIGELPLEAQVKLLRVLQDRVVERLGGSHGIKVDVRIIAATNRNLAEAVAAKIFRDDLYYRLSVFPIRVPPLRERADDIPGLVWSFVEELSKSLGKTITNISKEDMAAIQAYAWPGNIRELRNVIEYAMIVSSGPRLEIGRLGARVVPQQTSLKLSDVEAAHITSMLERTGWRVRGPGGAAELLGLKPTTLEGRMAKLGLKRPPK